MRRLRRFFRRFPRTYTRWLVVPAFAALIGLGFATFAFLRAQHTLNRSTERVAQLGRYSFDLRKLDLYALNRGTSDRGTQGSFGNPGFELIASPTSYASGAFFRGRLYISGPSGLSVFSTDGLAGATLLRNYRVGLELPAAPLGAMVVGRLRGSAEPELLIATGGAGVLMFLPGKTASEAGSFRQLLPHDKEVRTVSALLPLASGELLIGTEHHGLLVYRGAAGSNDLESFHPLLANLAITALAADASGFWVGTRNHGVRHWHGGQLDSFDAGFNSADGSLPDEQVEAIEVHGDKVFVGTPLGIEEFDHGRPARVLAKNLFAHALFADDRALTIGTIDAGEGIFPNGRIQRVSLESERRPGAGSAVFLENENRPGGTPQLFIEAGADAPGGGHSLYAVLHSGILQQHGSNDWVPLRAAPAALKTAVLTDGNISALAFAPDGRLWVGYFDRGLDVLTNGSTAGSELVVHQEDDHLFCINRIVVDPRRKTMAVATANGLVMFDAQGKQRQTLTRKDGLIADHVTDITFSREAMVLATPAGVTYVDAAGARSLYGFQGLVNNHVYALASRPDSGEVLAGTLGGISVLVDEDVQRNLTAANSGLQHNWVTAIVPAQATAADGRWMVGTYGAGVVELDQDGRFTPMDGVTQSMVVNPNAMLQTGRHILAGTLGKGLWVWSRNTSRWRQITAGLPSTNVTAIAESGGVIYVGTDNGLVRIAESLLD